MGSERSGWFGLPSFVITIIGAAIAVYLTVDHFDTGAVPLACPATGIINCAKVTDSSWSYLVGVPVAVLGLIYFVAMAVLCSPPAWRIRSLAVVELGRVRFGWAKLGWVKLDLIRVLGAVLGVIFALYLVWAELFRI
ncbi:MAG: hypothetical protein FWD74_12595, partial [Actinomycetia bacterium]|nr:hypothetical protein [Actinomycetes bacterium]